MLKHIFRNSRAVSEKSQIRTRHFFMPSNGDSLSPCSRSHTPCQSVLPSSPYLGSDTIARSSPCRTPLPSGSDSDTLPSAAAATTSHRYPCTGSNFSARAGLQHQCPAQTLTPTLRGTTPLHGCPPCSTQALTPCDGPHQHMDVLLPRHAGSSSLFKQGGPIL